MKPHRSHLFFSGVAIFCIALAAATAIRYGMVRPANEASDTSTLLTARSPVDRAGQGRDPSYGEIKKGMKSSARGILAQAKSVARLSTPRLQELVEEAAGDDSDDAYQALRLFLLEWAQRDSKAALRWVFAHGGTCGQQTSTVWMARDPVALGKWLFEEFPPGKNERDDSNVVYIVSLIDPLALAAILEGDPLGNGMASFPAYRYTLERKADRNQVAEGLIGKISFLPPGNPGEAPRTPEGRQSWTDLFLETAVQYHKADAPGYEAWIRKFPPLARQRAQMWLEEGARE